MKTKIFCDIADYKTIKFFNNKSLVDGFTTNPSLMRLAGAKNYKEYSLKILNICKNKPISFEVFADNFKDIEEHKYQPLSSYPYIKFDLSFTVKEQFSASELIQYIETLLPENENNISIFDNFRNEKSRNLGIRIVTRNYKKTYTDTESGEILDMIVKKVQSKYSIKLNTSDNDAT